ncbi:GDSL esterase/lipase At3g48460-like [Cornus florida]|uniref:GDSL esterase/lipase At3g48460-like n=1 Tax=Cornus florida TaxID=4283 RepID=UPI002899C45D|nr:GDSL esterase/lipase At3g48460-like [Cornus florida]
MMKLNSHFLSLPLLFLFLFLSPSSATYNHKSPPPAPNCHQPATPVSNDKPSSPGPSQGPSSPVPPNHKPYSPVPSSKPPSPVPPSHKPYSPVPSSKPPSPVPSSKPPPPFPPSYKPYSPVPSSKPPSPVPSPVPNNQPSSPVPSPVSYTPTSSSPSPLSDSPSSPSPPLDGSYKGCFSKVFAFGDSYTDTGNAQFMGNIASSGSKNRLSNGRMVIDYLCDALSIPPLSPYKDSNGNFDHGVNFAVSGSTCLPKECFSNGTIPHTLMYKRTTTVQTQIEWFHEHVQNVACKGKDVNTCKTEMSKSLIWIGAMGVSDYTRVSGSSSFNIQRIADMSITHMSKLMQTLLESGAKNIVVHGLPPVGCLSSGISLCPRKNYDKMGCAMTTNTAVMIHNRILQRMITRFQGQFPHCKILYADYWNAYLNIFTHPKQYHFEEPFKACCGAGDGKLNFNLNSVCGSPGTSSCKDPNKYMNWDGIHLTESMQHHISDLFLNQNFCRPSFSQFFKNKMGGM